MKTFGMYVLHSRVSKHGNFARCRNGVIIISRNSRFVFQDVFRESCK